MNQTITTLITIAVLAALGGTATAQGDIAVYTHHNTTPTFTKAEMAEHALEYAELSKAVYNNATPPGWEKIANWQDLLPKQFFMDASWNNLHEKGGTLSGFNANLYKKGKKYVLAFKGTDPRSLAEWEANLDDETEIFSDLLQHNLALIISTEAKKRYGEIEVTGHSLGGGLAQYASSKNDLAGVVFNPMDLRYFRYGHQETENRLTIVNTKDDLISFTGKNLGTLYERGLTDRNRFDEHHHDVEKIISQLQQTAVQQTHGENVIGANNVTWNNSVTWATNVAWANVGLTRGRAIATISNNVSHIGNTHTIPPRHDPTKYAAQPTGVVVGDTVLSETEWVLTNGDEYKHLGLHESGQYGPINSDTAIASLNNFGVPITTIQKSFSVPIGQRTLTFETLANFVTSEFPDYIDSKYNDRALIQIITPGGRSQVVTIFEESVNQSVFTLVSGIPYPLSVCQEIGGHTGFVKADSTVNVAPGGKVIVEVSVENVGDTEYASAILLTKTTAR